MTAVNSSNGRERPESESAADRFDGILGGVGSHLVTDSLTQIDVQGIDKCYAIDIIPIRLRRLHNAKGGNSGESYAIRSRFPSQGLENQLSSFAVCL